MKPILRDYIYFTRSQRKALLIISIFIGLLIAFNQTAHLIFENEIDLEVEYLEVKLKELQKKEASALAIDPEAKEGFGSKVHLFPFDPNQITRAEWQLLGLSEAQAGSIMKYLAKGGKFKIKADLKKMYVVSNERYSEWEPYIKLPDHLPELKADPGYLSKSKRRYEALVIDLNLADSADFIKLSGIGPVYASRIVKFRNVLGGFYSIDQLTEVWGLEDSIVDQLSSQLEITDSSLRKIDLNSADIESLKSHPYLSWKQARAIVNYRKQHGIFTSLNDLKELIVIDDSLFQKIEPYLKVKELERR